MAPSPSPRSGSTPSDRVQLTARNLRGIAHPVRVRLLGLLRLEGPATATTLARRLGLNSGATSYHLRQLASHGFIVEDPHRGTNRERWWQAAHRVSDLDRALLDDDETAMGSVFVRAVAEVYAEQMRRAADELPALPPEWRREGRFSDYQFQLTPDQLRQLVAEVAEVLAQYPMVDPAASATNPGTAVVSFQFQAFPRPGTIEGDEP